MESPSCFPPGSPSCRTSKIRDKIERYTKTHFPRAQAIEPHCRASFSAVALTQTGFNYRKSSRCKSICVFLRTHHRRSSPTNIQVVISDANSPSRQARSAEPSLLRPDQRSVAETVTSMAITVTAAVLVTHAKLKRRLEAAERKCRTLCDCAGNCCFLLDDISVVYYNQAAAHMRGASAKDSTQDPTLQSGFEQIHRQHRLDAESSLKATLRLARPAGICFRLLFPDSLVRHNFNNIRTDLDSASESANGSGASPDIAEQTQRNVRFRYPSKERKVLVKLLDHRSRNDLQVIYNLLSKPVDLLEDERAIHPLREDGRLGLEKENSLNELVANAWKHVLPSGQGTLCIGPSDCSYDSVWLSVSGTGLRFLKDVSPKHSKSLGLPLVVVLAFQRSATLHVQAQSGTIFKLIFPHSGAT